MREILENYRVMPKVVCSGHVQRIKIIPQGDHVTFKSNIEYSVQTLPMLNGAEGYNEKYTFYKVFSSDGTIEFEHCFTGQQEYIIRIYNGSSVVYQTSIFCLEEEHYTERIAWMGDLHVHSNRSDGRDEPAFVAAYYRKAGFDFMALTDHGRYTPSLDMINRYKDVTVDLAMFPGEEIHLWGNHVHTVNFGGEASVNELAAKDEQKYKDEVNALAAELDIPEGVSRFEYAACVWIYNNIRKFNGLAIFPHPHWRADAYHVRDIMSEAQFKNRIFDAFELLGGQSVAENNMQVAFYNDMRAKGYDVPIVGSSDSHGTLVDYYFKHTRTVVFSSNNSKSDIIGSIKKGRSVAVEQYPNGEPRVYGKYELVSYAIFLMQEYFPLHDELCFEEGLQMKRYLCGYEDAAEHLQLLHGRTDALRKEFFGE